MGKWPRGVGGFEPGGLYSAEGGECANEMEPKTDGLSSLEFPRG